ncbi:olfactory receptor 52E4-like [Protopterus annectens]|uniref:olfactory receptor 52E4-like n=1 Tax=Protopterus annectens TaxID=7888 RepID=UPI001CFAF8C8|nr:olfactory receptor 52E4-like [Protopterus annectens]
MSLNKSSGLYPKEFILTGFPGLENVQYWFSIPFFIIYVAALTGNAITLLVIKAEQSLHEPMYLFICMLAVVDITLVITLLNKLLGILWFNSTTITFEMCIIQMFTIHFFTSLNTSLLVVMAFDRYLAVYNPLRYPNIVTNKFIAIASMIVLARCLAFILPLPFFAVEFQYCATNVIAHCYCEIVELVNIACEHFEACAFYLKCLFLLITMPDTVLVGLSYSLILKIILRMKTKEARQKAFSTCISHFFVILTFHLLSILSYVLNNVLPYVRVITSVLFIVLPSALNPFIYCIRLKQIHEKIAKVLNSMVASLFGV